MYHRISTEAKLLNAVGVYLVNDIWLSFSDAPGDKHEALYAQLVMPDGSVMKSTTIPYVRHGGQIEWGPLAVSEDPTNHQNMLPGWGKFPTAS
jgi:hypothetical protein